MLPRSASMVRLAQSLPRGEAMPHEAWRARHQVMLVVLGLHAAVIAVVSGALSGDLAHGVLEATPIAAAGIIAADARIRPSVRSAIATAGLFTASATIVHMSGGYIEAHFHFFVMVGLITLYQSWVPFATALGMTVAHHATIGVLRPELVYNHPAALDRPVLWAGIHGVLVLAAAVTHLFSWRLSEERFRDVMTGLANRVLFDSRLERALATAAQGGAGVTVLFLDLDDFKAVNDELGHAAGDELLGAVGRRLERCLGDGDVVARVGGDEFAVLLMMSDATSPSSIAERITTALARPFDIRETAVVIGASAGIATFDGSQSADRLVRNADAAMYAAKRAGKGQHRYFDQVVDGAP